MAEQERDEHGRFASGGSGHREAYEGAKAEHQKAMADFREVSAKHREVTADYRARKIGDNEYLASRRAQEVAGRVVDRAESKLNEIGEPASEPKVEEDRQLGMKF